MMGGKVFLAALLATVPAQAIAAPDAVPVPAPIIAADPSAAYVKASGWVEGAEGRTFVELLIDGDDAALRTRVAGASRPRYLILTYPADALMLLADRRLEFLWAPLTDWTGPSLERMRARMIRRFRSAMETARPDAPSANTSESTVRPRVRALLQYARMLDLTGHGADAEEMLRGQLSTMRFKQGGGWRGIEWSSVATAIAVSRVLRDDRAGAIAEYATMERAMGRSPYTVNAIVNRAASLAMDGQYVSALATVDQAWARYLKENQGDKVPGSERQFAWIRACALSGLGRDADARVQERVLRDDRELYDDHFVIEPDNDLLVRSAKCRRDGAEVARLIGRDLRRVGRSQALILLQPAYRARGADVAIIDAVRADPALKAAAATHVRVLPPEMTAALNGWK